MAATTPQQLHQDFADTAPFELEADRAAIAADFVSWLAVNAPPMWRPNAESGKTA